MKISPINVHNINFKSTERTKYQKPKGEAFILSVYDTVLARKQDRNDKIDTKIIVSNSTNFFRNDLPWGYIAEILDTHFPEGKVNIHNFACSDGSETFSLIMALIEQLGEEKAQRFFPIIASDCDSEIIKIAQSGKINATFQDIEEFEHFGNTKKYFDIQKTGLAEYTLTLKDTLTKNAVFTTASMEKGLDKIKKGNNVILCRNFWKYLSLQELAQTSWKLKQKVDEKSLVLIGKFDLKDRNIPLHLSKLGFDYATDYLGEENILKYYRNLDDFAKQSYSTWKNFVKEMYRSYIPKYIK